jgi:hypothetical protein
MQAFDSCLSHNNDLRNVQGLLLSKGEEQQQEIYLVLNHIILSLQTLTMSYDGSLLINFWVYTSFIFLNFHISLLTEISKQNESSKYL